jgi:hypothetical protein
MSQRKAKNEQTSEFMVQSTKIKPVRRANHPLADLRTDRNRSKSILNEPENQDLTDVTATKHISSNPYMSSTAGQDNAELIPIFPELLKRSQKAGAQRVLAKKAILIEKTDQLLKRDSIPLRYSQNK